MIKKFEQILYNYFSDIIYVKSNPAEIYIRDITKSGDKLVINELKEVYNLQHILIDKNSKNLFTPECYSSGLIGKIVSNSELINVNFYPKNFLQKIIKNPKKSLKKNLQKILSDTDYQFVITTPEISEVISEFSTETTTKCDYLQHSLLENLIVIGKKSKIIINENFEYDKVNTDLLQIEFWVDYDNFKVFRLS
jgi:hypothetical protein